MKLWKWVQHAFRQQHQGITMVGVTERGVIERGVTERGVTECGVTERVLSPFLIGRMFVRRTYFGQFDELQFVS